MFKNLAYLFCFCILFSSCDISQENTKPYKQAPSTNNISPVPRISPQSDIYIGWHAVKLKQVFSKICTRPIDTSVLFERCGNFTITPATSTSLPKFKGYIYLSTTPIGFYGSTHQLYLRRFDGFDDVYLSANDYFLPKPLSWQNPLEFITSSSDVNNIFP